MLTELTRAVDPPMCLSRVIEEWNGISRALAEPHRHRSLQLAEFFE